MEQESEFKMVNTSWMLPGVTCWITTQQDQENHYIRAIIISLTQNRQNARLTYPDEKGPDEVPVQDVQEANQDYENYKNGWDDMVTMNVLNEAEIIANVKLRYSLDIIFTYIGPTLIVMNPYKYISKTFQQSVIEHYQQALYQFDMRDHPPHVYAISAQAYSQLFSASKNQAIVISGESGAGKTENAKYAMKFLTSLSKKQEDDNETPIEDKILSCNPILEAFGNAKTVRNDNSSRFGKYVRIWVDKNSKRILGASISNYLLEKSRVTSPSEGERNYHIFYFMLKGYQQLDEIKENKKLMKFNYLQGSYDVETLNDQKLFEEVMNSFKLMQFSEEQITAIFNIVQSILLLGNIQFEDASLTDSEPCQIKNKNISQKISTLLQLDENNLTEALVYKTREVTKQIIKSPNQKIECQTVTTTLSRAIYDKLFNWLVKKLNQTIMGEDNDSTIGLLDIFGFENFQLNSFEQLCINFTNEKLQQLYISYVFKSEEHEFIKEGLKDYLQTLAYNDNQPIIDLIDKYPLSIFDLLDESCQLGQATDEQYIQKLAKTHAETPNFKTPKMVKDKFFIKHTPKDVEYCVIGFRAKNKDELSRDLDRGINSSQNENIVRIWQNLLDDEDLNQQQVKGSSKENKFLSAKFRRQMKELMEELTSCDVHFIRCIKPNEEKKKDYYLKSYVLLQVRYLGILESVKVRKEGYPIRSEYTTFYTRYHELDQINRRIRLQRHLDMGTDMKGLVKEIVNRTFPKLDRKIVLYGNTKIYMKMDIAHRLDRLLQEWWKYKSEKASIIQRAYKHYMMKKRIKIELKRIHQLFIRLAKIQAYIRMRYIRKRYLKKKEAINKSKKFLIKVHKRCLKRNFDKFLSQSKNAPKKEKNKLKVIERKFLPTLDKYFKRINLWKWRDIASQLSEQADQYNEQQYQDQEQYYKESDYLQEDQYGKNDLNYEDMINQFSNDMAQLKDDINLQIEEQFKEEENMTQLDLQTDQFEVTGLRIWSVEQYLTITPLLQHFIKKNKTKQLPKNYYQEANQQWQKNNKKFPKIYNVPLIEIASYATASEKLTSQDYDADFMDRVKEANFFMFCDQNLYKHGQLGQIDKVMSFSMNYLKYPLLPIHSHFKDALEINKCIFKLCELKRTRHTKEFLQERILVLLLGPNCILPMPSPSNDLTNDQKKNYETLKFFKEKKMEQLLPGYRAFVQLSQKNQKEDTVILFKPFLNLVKNKYASYVNEWQQDNQLQSGIILLRDEAYLQLGKMLYDNPYPKALNLLYKFTMLLSYLIVPSKKTIYPVLNFFLDRMENEKDEQNNHYARIIFNNLARQAIQLEVLFNLDEIRELTPLPNEVLPSNWTKSGYQIPINLIKKLKLYKRDPINERLSRIANGLDSLYDLMISSFSIISGRMIIPSIIERFFITQRKQLLFRISINQHIIWVPFDPMNTAREVKNTLMYQLGMEKLLQYYALWMQVEIDNQTTEGFWLPDSSKVLDIVAKEANDSEIYSEYYNKNLTMKVFLKIRVFYPIFKEDKTSILYLFEQLVQQVSKGEFPLEVENAIQLAALQIYIENIGEITQEQLSIKLNSYLSEGLISGAYQNARFKQHNERYPIYSIQDWCRKILKAYQKLEFENQDDARWLYINILRTQDLFMCHQIKCSVYIVLKGNFGVLKRKKYFPGYIGIRPNHIIIVDWPSRKTFKILEFDDISQWGRAVGSDCQLYIKLNKGQTIFLQMGEDGLDQIDYFMNAYLNWESCLPLDSHLIPPPTVQKTEFNLNQYNTIQNDNNSIQDDRQEDNQNQSNYDSSYYSQYNQQAEFDYEQFNNEQYNYDF